jgi:tetratricopeptide (TPR) repeat protein
MKGALLCSLVFCSMAFGTFETAAETESIDLKALAKKARPAVFLLAVSDADGKEIANGTGFLVSSDGKLITNHHVIENAVSAVAKAENGGLFPVEGVLADDPKNDLVLLKLKGKDLPFLTLGNSDKVEVGTRIAVIGSPLGLEGTLSEGIVSGIRGEVGQDAWVQITAAISPGSSGSPVLGTGGEVLGVAAMVIRGGQSLNFAIPARFVKGVLQAGNNASPRSLFSSNAQVDEEEIRKDPVFKALLMTAIEDKSQMLRNAQALLSRYPDSAFAHSTVAMKYTLLRFHDEAMEEYKKALKLNPRDSQAWSGLAGCYAYQEKYEDAAASYRRAINLFPEDWSAWWGLSVVLSASKKYDEAVDSAQQATKLMPDLAAVWLALANACKGQQKYGDAEQAYLKAISLDPSDFDSWIELGAFYSGQGKHAEAEKVFEKAVKLDPASAAALDRLCVSLIRLERYDEALKIVAKLEPLNPDRAARLKWLILNPPPKPRR